MTKADQDSAENFDDAAFLRSLTSDPGVYRMIGGAGEILYVGKARNLKKRVSTYFRKSGLAPKTAALMSQARSVSVTVTHTENEALILECNLIKTHKPRYNVLLRDDKSYPEICVSTSQDFPRITIHRGARKAGLRYFGPYPSAHAVHESLHLLQKVFRMRQCEDSFFRNRSRPCLQHQIKRCSGPCVGLVDRATYARDVERTLLFLEGKNEAVIDDLVVEMERHSAAQCYEAAAQCRDQIASLRRIQERQYITGERGDLDIVSLAYRAGVAAVQVFFIRSGRNLGNRTFFPRVPADSGEDEILIAFLSQYYLKQSVPHELLLGQALKADDAESLMVTLQEVCGHTVSIRWSVRGERRRWVELASRNADHALAARLSTQAGVTRRLESLVELLQLDEVPQRIECFDISHTSGEATVASCVVFGPEGPVKSDYRRFNIEGVGPGDDYGAMSQALTRRYTRLRSEEAVLPDILLIDGGKGQVSMAEAVMRELQIDHIRIVGVAKGPSRRPGQELLVVPGGQDVRPDSDSPGLHLIQQVRDEAHRFAITGHRQRRGKARKRSPLEQIPGIGPTRRQRLLKQFGGLQEIARAGTEDIASVKGISVELAQKIYAAFHQEP